MTYTLYPFQQEALELLTTKYKSKGFLQAGIFWEMRLGKTIVALKTCKDLGFRRVLIICPKTINVNWKEQVENFELPNPVIFTRENKRTLQQYDDGASIYGISNPEWVQSRRPGLHYTSNWDCVIYDESHGLRNPKTSTAKFFLKKYRKVANKLLLTGTPKPNSLIDVVQQMIFMKDSFMGFNCYWRFKHAICDTSGLYNQYITINAEHLQEYQDELNMHCLQLKRSDVNVGSKKHYMVMTAKMAGPERKQYTKMEEDWEVDGLTTKYIIVTNNYLHQMAGGFLPSTQFKSDHKLKILKNLFQNDLKNQKVVIWCNYRYEQKQIESYLIENKLASCKLINGDVSQDERHRHIKAFNTPYLDALVCTYGTVDQGTDFSIADHCIYYSSTYSPVQRQQSEDRIINIKKKHPVLYIDLVTEDTIDEDIRQAHKMKKLSIMTIPQLILEAYNARKKNRNK